MATNNNDLPINTDPNAKRTSSEFLPKYFRTLPNKKFLAATMDQMIQTGVAEKLNAYYGRRNAKAVKIDDNYIPDVSDQRQNYQFEPAAVVQDELDNVVFYKDYIDLVNQLKNYAGNTDNHSRNFTQESYSWNPHINWDKFVNFREYYWMPFGPQVIDVFGQSKEVVSTYTVTLAEDEEEAYIFSPDGLTRNPSLKLYRGQTYRFEIDSPGHPIAFSTNRQFTPPQTIVTASQEGIRANGDFDVKLYDVDTYDYGDFFIIPPKQNSVNEIDSENVSNVYDFGIRAISDDGEATVYIEKGTIEFTVPVDAPDLLYYVSKNDIDLSGIVKILDIEENTAIDVASEIIGKKYYKSSNGVEFINGMRVKFGGEVTPESYSDSIYYIEGVGDKIKLVDEKDLEVFTSANADINVPFEENPFDRIPFSQANGYTAEKDYIVSNRSSQDKNQWARSNKWIHRQVIELAAKINQLDPEFDESTRAKRPIIEFEANLRLADFGTFTKQSVDLVDTFTKDVFSVIEGSQGYNIDGIDLLNGMRVLVTADTDVLANNKIYEVKFITFNNTRQITLVETEDSNPIVDEVVYARNGNTLRGKMFYYDGNKWHQAQDKTKVNQPIIFNVYDTTGVSIYDYAGVINPGTTLFSYSQGTGSNDVELGFPLNYRVVENSGDILFNFNLLSDVFEYQENQELKTIPAEQFRLKKYKNSTDFVYESGWKKSNAKSYQDVIRLYTTEIQRNNFEIDVYNSAYNLTDLKVKVFVNNILKKQGIDYELQGQDDKLFVLFVEDLNSTSTVELKCRSKASKNENGYYEIATNLERNPLNDNPTTFTFGEVSDHVSTIVEEIPTFEGSFPGNSNLDNVGELTSFGRKFLQHSGPANLAMYHLLDTDANIIRAIEESQREYSQFKRELLQVATKSSFDGTACDFLDNILDQINKDKINTMPYYFSDMLGRGSSEVYKYTVVDPQNKFYALPKVFDKNIVSNQAVYVYVNDSQLTHDKDYYFTAEGFVYLKADIIVNDVIKILYYENTDASYVPSTPTKLGLYPSFEPQIYTDTSYLEPTKVIQGHDGSITVAYNDYRDEILLEFELRIFNNLKVSYDANLIDIDSFVGGKYRKTDFSKQEINQILISDFIKWLELVGNKDYSDIEEFYDLNNSLTFNYNAMLSSDGEALKGFWRAVYIDHYDTDTPHLTPWRMLGIRIKPDWWESVYGPAPYTKDNLILWQDLQDGVVKDPTKNPVYKSQYARPNLVDHIPVDAKGNLISPYASGLATNFVGILTKQSFEFGDVSPVESAWRRSSDYAFALIKSWLILQPCHLLGLGYDRSRIFRDATGQIVYKDTNKRLRLEDLVLPNTSKENSRRQTVGLVNYVLDYMSKGDYVKYNEFKEKIVSLKNNLGIRLGGYTDKSKFNMILDSRTPLNQGNVFVPQENFHLFLNTSTAVNILTYSGVLIEKTSKGFIVRGYNKENPVFNYFKPIERQNDSSIRIGGVSEDFINWDSNQVYIKGQLVEYEGRYFRCQEQHTSSQDLDEAKFVRLPELPTIGGVTARNRKVFSTNITTINYGTIFSTIQEIVDFLLGYGAYLESQGFTFDYFNQEYNLVENWLFSAKEFLFWTTQNWGAGSILTISPGATSLSFKSNYATVDDIFDRQYNYSIVQSDGKNIPKENVTINRISDNTFSISVKNTNEGIFGAKIPVVQKEHIVVLDNTTVFNDVIYNLEPGYRQERIRILGYRTDEWNGSFNIPGFIYDNVKITTWDTWKDYAVGDVVKYKEYYYVALENISGAEEFDNDVWQQLSEKPESTLQGNLEYKTNQFADFYDLDTDNFNTEQQKLAQHLIGYQKRDYLQNIINDDVSQYKFYQGYIQEKGTFNSLTKLFDALSSADQDSLDFYEEWAVKLGHYGAVDGVEEVEYTINEQNYRLEPQPFNLVDILPSNNIDLIYNLTPGDAYLKPGNYIHRPFPTKNILTEYVGTAGYVNTNDVDFTLEKYDDILNLNIDTVEQDLYIWTGSSFEDSWNVYRYINSGVKVSLSQLNEDGSSQTQGNLEIQFNKVVDYKVGQIFGVVNSQADGFYKIVSVGVNHVTIDSDIEPEKLEGGNITIFVPQRYTQFTDLKNIAQNKYINNTKVWIDELSGSYKNTDNITKNREIVNENVTGEFLDSYAVDLSNKTFVVGSPSGGLSQNGQINIYARDTKFATYQLNQELELNNSTITELSLDKNITITQNQIVKQQITNTVYAEGRVITNVSNSNSLQVEVLTAQGFVQDNLDELYLGDSSLLPNSPVKITQVDIIRSNAPNICDALPRFGDSVAISPDGAFILAGAPDASNIKTKFVGDYSVSSDYNINDIVKYQENYYKALDAPAKEVAPRTYETFYNVASIETEIGNNNVGWLLTGGYPLNNLTIDNDSGNGNILVRVSKDQFDAVDLSENPQIVLHYIDSVTPLVEPFDGTVLGIDYTFLNQPHTILEKVEAVIYVDNSFDTPIVGDILTAGNSTVEVTDVFVKNDSFSVYVKNIKGVFLAQGELFVGDFKLGDYTVVAPDESYDALGGYFKISTPSIDVRDITRDETDNLVYVDILVNSENDNSIFYAIEESVKDAGTVVTNNDRASYIARLESDASYRWVVRLPVEMDPQPGDVFDLIQSPRTNENLSVLGLDSVFNRSQTISEVWDGFIDVQLDTPVSQIDTSLIEPLIGNLIFESTSSATGTIQFVEDIGQNIRRCYITTTTSWAEGADFNDSDRILIRDLSRSYVAQEIGFLKSSSIKEQNPSVGKLAVFQETSALPSTGESASFDFTYWVYQNSTLTGLGLPASIPSPTNLDWQIVTTIEADEDGTASGFTKEGFISVFEKLPDGSYSKVNDLIPSDRTNNNNLEFGSNIVLTKNNDLYTAFVKANNRVYIIKHGIDSEGKAYNWQIAKDAKFRDIFNDTYDYYTGDIVAYDRFVGAGEEYILYKAKTNIIGESSTPIPTNTAYWEEISADIDYTGFIPVQGLVTFDDSTVYDASNAVVGEYIASTTDGKTLVVSSKKDGNNDLIVYVEGRGRYKVFQTIEIQIENIEYLESIALSQNGEYIAIGKFNENVERIIDAGEVDVYQLQNNSYTLVQTLASPSNESNELFGYSVSFNSSNDIVICGFNGDKIVDESFADDTYFDNNFTQFKKIYKDYGILYNFENINGEFIFSSLVDNYKKLQGFGKRQIFNNDHLYVIFSDTLGEVVEYRKSANTAWQLVSEQQSIVDIDKIKSCFVYNKGTGNIIEYVDFIDPIQGKFAGPAEQELSYKTKYDPATYSIGTDLVNVNDNSAWGPRQIGKVWLDLSTIKFINPYQAGIQYATNNWNNLFIGSDINVYEWVETTLLPEEWNELADTTEGLTQGVSGTTKHGNEIYAERNIYDNIAGTFSKKYYYWVTAKKTIPSIENRNISVYDIEQLIQDPAGQGYKFVALISDQKFALFNCKNLFSADDCALHFSYYTIENQSQNMHSEYQLIAEGLGTSKPKDSIVEKWIDSLVGYDINTREVPDPLLSPREKYGNLHRPRQGWFVNRLEALKEFIERTNLVLKNNLIVDEYNLIALNAKDPIPSNVNNEFDIITDSESDLQFIGTKNIESAVLEPVLEDGKIVDVRILNPGYGYKVSPSYEIIGTGEDAQLQLNIDETGKISSVRILNNGYRYEENTRIVIRPFAVLVTADSSILGKWSVYQWNKTLQTWQRSAIQDFDVSTYWNYIDWYAEGYNEFTNVDYYINNAFELPTIQDTIGDVIKIKTIGSGGWLLLEKIDNQDADYDYTINYKTIGQENGTIQISNNLYDFKDNTASFDGFSYDVDLYDNIPIKETRAILQSIRDDLLVDELEAEWNKLFFSSIRYVLSEQPFVNWLFKTSFVKAKHNLGELSQKITYQNDNLPSYEDYINEVKPFKTKIREYLSAYQKTDNTQSVVTDFDLVPVYNDRTGKIEVPRAIVLDNVIQSTNTDLYPNVHWAENNTFVVDSIEISNPGNSYVVTPVVNLEGGGGTGATARAYINSGKITRIEVTNSGSGYITAPEVIINGSVQEGGSQGSATAIIKNNKVRTIKTSIKFDRISKTTAFDDLFRSQTIQGFANQQSYELNWPIDLQESSIKVFVDNIEQLTQSYQFDNKDKNLGYTSQVGYITFVKTLPKDSTIRVEYQISQSYVNATDRIQHFYNPTTGMYGKDFAQLMHGVDYGGVEVRSFDFNNITGWDSVGWYSDLWDTYDIAYQDIIIDIPGNTNTFTLQAPLESGVEYNVYIGQIGQPTLRIDDSNWIPAYDEITGLKLELETLLQESTSAKNALVTKQAEVESKTAELNRAEDELDLLTPGSQEYIDKSQEITDLFAELTDLQLEEDELQDTYDTSITNVNNKQTEVDNVQQQIDASPLLIETAGMTPITGDGETLVYTFPQRFNNDLIEKTVVIRKTTSDGTIAPDETSYDTALSGGALNYANAKGIDAGEIIIDGDGFVTPTTSAGPEEHVPGQILDTLDIRVYDRVGEGAPMMVARNYKLSYYAEEQAVTDAQNLVDLTTSAITTETDPAALANLQSALIIYSANLQAAKNNLDQANIPLDLGELPATEDSVFVKLDNKIITKEQYNIDFKNKKIKIITPPPAGTVVSTVTMSTNGANILDIGNFIADGSTTQFLVPVEWQDNLTAFVAVNGEKYSGIQTGRAERVQIIQSDETYNSINKVILNFENAPAAGDIINYAVYASSTKSFSEVELTRFVGDGSTRSFELAEAPFTLTPIAQNIVVISEDKLLSPGYYEKFDITSSRRYQLDLSNYPRFSLAFTDDNSPLRVYVNNQLLTYSTQYIWLPEESAIELKPSVGSTGDLLEVYIENSQYSIQDNIITLEQAPSDDADILVYTFSNHDSLATERTENNVILRDWYVVGDGSFSKYSLRSRGYIKLATEARDIAYVWASINGELLIANVDYYLVNDKDAIQIVRPINDGDRIEIVHFTGTPVSTKFGYRQFKDILNRTHYKRLNSVTETELAQDLSYTDLRIEVADGSVLTTPNKNANIPGIIFVNGERIEYFVKEGNTLRQIRRGTLGTSINEFVAEGTKVAEQGNAQTVPYGDKTHVLNFEIDGSTTRFTLDFPAEHGVNGFEVFLAGVRLRKNEIEQFDYSADDPNVLKILPAEFSVELDGAIGQATTSTLQLNMDADRVAQLFAEGAKVTVIRKTLNLWTPKGISLKDADTTQGIFLREATIDLPK